MTCSSAVCDNVMETRLISQLLHCLKTTISLTYRVLSEILKRLIESLNDLINRSAKLAPKICLLMLCAGLAVRSSVSLL